MGFVSFTFEMTARKGTLAFVADSKTARARSLVLSRSEDPRHQPRQHLIPSTILLLLLLLCMPMVLSSIILEDDSNALIQDISYVPSSAILPFFGGFQAPAREPS